MQAPLNRIESEYIFKSFLQEKPPLTILHANGVLRLSGAQYKVKNSHIFFKWQQIKILGKITVIFTHKRRPFYFIAQLDTQDVFLYFTFSPQLYKYDYVEKDSGGKIIFTDAGGGKFSADISDDFPLKINSDNIFSRLKKNAEGKEEYKRFSIFTERFYALTEMPEKNTPTYILERIYEIAENGKLPKTEPCLIFSDGSYILIFTALKKAERISLLSAAQTEIRFRKRRVYFLSSFLFRYPLPYADDKKGYAAVCLSIENIQEEDKRFLYENTYSAKYGK